MDGNGYLVVFKDGLVRFAPVREAFVSDRCERESCQGCAGRRCDVRCSMPIGQFLDKEEVCSIQDFLTSEDSETPISVRRRALGEVCEPGGLLALGIDEKEAIEYLMLNGSSQTVVKFQLQAAFACDQNR